MTFLRRRHASHFEDSGDACANDAGGIAHDDLPFAASMGLGAVELLVLDLVRCYCHGWASGQIAAWSHAFELAEQHLGPIEGPVFAARVVAVMRVLLRERRAQTRAMAI